MTKRAENSGETKGKRGGVANLKPFTKADPRINRKGRPRTLSELRALIQSLANEPSDGKPEWTRLIVMLRAMLVSRSPADRKELLRYGYGEPPQETTNLNVDWSQLTDEQLERIAKGEDVRRVITAASAGRAGTAPPTTDDRADNP